MSYKYEHMTSLDWMRDRQKYITASDVAKLVPYTNTGRARTITDEDYFALMADKLRMLTEEDCLSFGAAARGHILEPYAIKEYNEIIPEKLYHWDDRCIPTGVAGYSPDALDVPMDSTVAPKIMGEVKCYSPAKHFLKSQTDLDKLEERWQLAMAFYVLPSLDKGYLILYNPELVDATLHIRPFKREDLVKELEIINDIVYKWEDLKLTFNKICAAQQKSTYTEAQIYQAYQAERIKEVQELQEGLLPSK